ncbi:hypothetical protein J7382_06630 [Shimia sp. R11_0]|uniref:hypothetical protein n=1 Tax=Shimia sp. R11_0 TaxID=2821096 RepID=UPI001ADB20B4|nr:hypothetical protein [Shimia sp. R11_0]MBO9477203.1 hypothetical protein [Shimia sp. R11_0]
MVTDLFEKGWAKLPFDAEVKAWAEHAWEAGQQSMHAPEHDPWWDCEGTWFIGVDALNNDVAGKLPGGPDLPLGPKRAIETLFGALPDLHPAQMSVVFPGYPKARRGENEAGLRYRRNRDAAHLDGLLRGEDGGRRVEEPHAWILGMPLTTNAASESPLVIWEGSHEVLREALGEVFAPHPPETWHEIDVRAVYQETRKTIFETCNRVPVCAQPGEAIVMHRLTLHGVAPWVGGDVESPCRAVAYFRPILAGGVPSWIAQDGG